MIAPIRSLEFVAVAVVLLLAAAGWQAWRSSQAADARARVEQAAAQANLARANAALAALEDARRRGDELQARVAAAEQARAALIREKDHVLAQAASGRACLRGAALRVLDGAPGLRVLAVPPAAGGAAAEDAAAAAAAGQPAGAEPSGPGLKQPPEAVASERQVARWMLAAGEQYEACRWRLAALVDWHTQTPANPAPPTP